LFIRTDDGRLSVKFKEISVELSDFNSIKRRDREFSVCDLKKDLIDNITQDEGQ
jgi:hypothetical protein